MPPYSSPQKIPKIKASMEEYLGFLSKMGHFEKQFANCVFTYKISMARLFLAWLPLTGAYYENAKCKNHRRLHPLWLFKSAEYGLLPVKSSPASQLSTGSSLSTSSFFPADARYSINPVSSGRSGLARHQAVASTVFRGWLENAHRPYHADKT